MECCYRNLYVIDICTDIIRKIPLTYSVGGNSCYLLLDISSYITLPSSNFVNSIFIFLEKNLS
jgi:hypothetical protein